MAGANWEGAAVWRLVRGILLLTILITLPMALAITVWAAPDDELALLDVASGEEIQSLDVAVASDQTSGATLVQVEWRPGAPDPPDLLSGVQISVVVVGAEGEVVPAVPEAGLALAPNDPTPLFVSVTGVADSGEYAGAVLAEVDGRVSQLATLTVTKASGPAAISVLATIDGELRFSYDAINVEAPIYVRNTADDALTPTLQVLSLRSPSGASVVVQLVLADGDQGNPAASVSPELTAGETAMVLLSADLEEVGEYRGLFEVLLDGESTTPVPLVIQRSGGEIPISISEGASVQEVGGAGTEATGSFDVTDTSGIPQELNFSLGRVRLVEEGREPSQTGLDLTIACSEPAQLTDDLGAADPDANTATCPLPANGTRTVEATIRGLPGPGQYTATIRVDRPGRAAKSADMTIFVRRPIWIAVICLTIGLVLSLAFALLTGSLKMRAMRRRLLRAIVDRFERVDFPRRPPYVGVQSTLTERINDLNDRIERKEENLEARISSVDRQVGLLPEWVRLRQEADVAGLGSLEDLAIVEDKIRAEVLADTEVAGVLENHRNAGRRLVAERDVRPKVAELGAAVAAWTTLAQPPPTTATRIQALLDEAHKAIGESQPGEAQAKWQQAASEWLGELVAALRAEVQTRPAWISEAEWSAMSAAAEVAMAAILERGVAGTPAMAWPMFFSASLAAVGRKAELLERVAQAEVDNTTKPPTSGRLAELTEVIEQTKASRAACNEDDLTGAREFLRTAVQSFTGAGAVVPEMPRRLIESRSGPPVSAPQLSEPTRRVRPIRSPRLVVGAINAGGFFLAVALALSFGVPTLYLSDQSWGSWMDITTALVWGFGLAAGQYTGIVALRNQLIGSPSA